MVMNSTPRAGTTVAAAVLDFILSGLFGLFALIAVIGGAALAGGSSDLGREFPGFGGFIGAAGGAVMTMGAVLLGVCVWAIVVGVKVLQRRTWARWAAVVTFSVFAVLSLISAASSDGPTPSGFSSAEAGSGAGVAVVLMLANAAIVVLLAVPSTSRDFDRARETEAWPSSRFGATPTPGGYGRPAYAPAGHGPPQHPPMPQGYAEPPYAPPGHGQPPPPPTSWGPPPGSRT